MTAKCGVWLWTRSWIRKTDNLCFGVFCFAVKGKGASAYSYTVQGGSRIMWGKSRQRAYGNSLYYVCSFSVEDTNIAGWVLCAEMSSVGSALPLLALTRRPLLWALPFFFLVYQMCNSKRICKKLKQYKTDVLSLSPHNHHQSYHY